MTKKVPARIRPEWYEAFLREPESAATLITGAITTNFLNAAKISFFLVGDLVSEQKEVESQQSIVQTVL